MENVGGLPKVDHDRFRILCTSLRIYTTALRYIGDGSQNITWRLHVALDLGMKRMRSKLLDWPV
jgi:hypothetical protein